MSRELYFFVLYMFYSQKDKKNLPNQTAHQIIKQLLELQDLNSND